MTTSSLNKLRTCRWHFTHGESLSWLWQWTRATLQSCCLLGRQTARLAVSYLTQRDRPCNLALGKPSSGSTFSANFYRCPIANKTLAHIQSTSVFVPCDIVRWIRVSCDVRLILNWQPTGRCETDAGGDLQVCRGRTASMQGATCKYAGGDLQVCRGRPASMQGATCKYAGGDLQVCRGRAASMQGAP
jgi:hypothetical protein